MIRLGWSRGVINRRVIRIRTVFRRAESKGKVPQGMWAALTALLPLERGDQRVKTLPPRRACEWKDLAKVCRFAPRTARDLLLCLYFTGARPSELRTLRVRDIDRSGDDWVAQPTRHKMAWRGQSRAIVIGPKARAVIERRLANLGPDDYVFAVEPGHCYADSDSFARAVARASERAGVKVTPYQCRHAAKQRITRALGLDHARAALGQSSLSTTDRYAAGADPKLAAEAARKSG
jgi:integrase